MYLTVDKMLNVTFYKIMLYILIHFWNLKYFYLFSAAILDFGSHFESVYGHKGTKYKFNCFLYIKCHSFTILYFIQEIQPICLDFIGRFGFWLAS